MTSETTLETYNRVADEFFETRSRTLSEKPWLDRMIGVAPFAGRPRRLLDLGCGTGLPIASYLADRGFHITGVDGAPEMIRLFRANLPGAEAIEADMRTLALGDPFDAILAWDSFFHLTREEQRLMFPIFRRHANPGAALMFTSGPAEGEVWGKAASAPIYHASLSPDEYQDLLAANQFEVIRLRSEDTDTNGRTIWLAKFTGG